MGRAKSVQRTPVNRESIAAREVAIRLAGRALSHAEGAVAMAHARTAAAWVAANRPDISFGVEPDLMLVAEDDHYSLVHLEHSGRAGNSVLLSEGAFGALWWCDPQGRETATHECLLYAAKGTDAGSARSVLMRFNRGEQL
ncbi:MAG: hypothetical protein E6R08_01170 [Nevskiaceae bacterium]|nr:MAG: hypothetical protein E6R08_01170 [Nevskiaceae bacterium]